MNADKPEYVFMSCQRIMGRCHSVKMPNKSPGNVTQFRCFGLK